MLLKLLGGEWAGPWENGKVGERNTGTPSSIFFSKTLTYLPMLYPVSAHDKNKMIYNSNKSEL